MESGGPKGESIVAATEEGEAVTVVANVFAVASEDVVAGAAVEDEKTEGTETIDVFAAALAVGSVAAVVADVLEALISGEDVLTAAADEYAELVSEEDIGKDELAGGDGGVMVIIGVLVAALAAGSAVEVIADEVGVIVLEEDAVEGRAVTADELIEVGEEGTDCGSMEIKDPRSCDDCVEGRDGRGGGCDVKKEGGEDNSKWLLGTGTSGENGTGWEEGAVGTVIERDARLIGECDEDESAEADRGKADAADMLVTTSAGSVAEIVANVPATLISDKLELGEGGVTSGGGDGDLEPAEECGGGNDVKGKGLARISDGVGDLGAFGEG